MLEVNGMKTIFKVENYTKFQQKVFNHYIQI